VNNTKPPANCRACQVERVAWSEPRVDFCYSCLPGGPFAAPACTACGSDRYFNNGLCDACHPRGPLHIETCLGCLAWGASRRYRSLCWTCRWWKTHYLQADCRSCRRHTFINESRVCRLCWEHAHHRREPGRALDVIGANQDGQQLFFANSQSSRQTSRRRVPYPNKHRAPRLSNVAAGQRFVAVDWEQLALFEHTIAPKVRRTRAVGIDTPLVRFCDSAIRDHATVHGWSRKHTNDVRRTLRLVSVDQHTPDAKINASDILKVPSQHSNVSAVSTIDLLTAVGLLNDDRTSVEQRCFVAQTTGLPATMRSDLQVWFDIMTNGSTITPRRHPRDPATTILHIRAFAPILRIWASQGHDTLASIERNDIVAVLPDNGPRRHTIEQGLRSLFRILKGRKLVFVDPIRTLPATDTNTTIPLPLDAGAVRNALNSSRPATALCAALVAFHGLTVGELCNLQLTDIRDRQLHLDGRVIPLAKPVIPRLSAWLDHRTAKWPATINPHLLVSVKTGPRLTPVSRGFPQGRQGLAIQALREDRILDEVRASGGDVRRICELFGISVETAIRYTTTLDHTNDDETPLPTDD